MSPRGGDDYVRPGSTLGVWSEREVAVSQGSPERMLSRGKSAGPSSILADLVLAVGIDGETQAVEVEPERPGLSGPCYTEVPRR